MSLQLTINYDNASNFTFDSNKVDISAAAELKNLETATDFTEAFTDGTGKTFDSNKIEFTGGKAQLKLEGNTGQTFNQNFSSDTGFTYDSSKTEFTGGKCQQKDATPTNSRIGITYDSVINADWNKDGATTGTADGSPTIVGGKLDCTGNTDEGVRYDVTHVGAGAIKWKYTPNYTGNPPNNVDVIGIRQPSTNNNRIILTHSPSGDNMRIWVTNSTGTAIYTATQIGPSSTGLVSGTDYEMELNWDNSNGNIRLFINGALHGLLNSAGSWTFVSNAAYLCVGGTTNTYNKCDAKYEDVLFFNAVQHTAGYTPGYTVSSSIYQEDLITMPNFTYSGLGAIVAYEGFSTTQTGSVRFNVNGQYWTGSAWASSDDSYSQMNSPADINTNIATLTPSDTVSIKFRTQDGSTVMDVDDLTVTYTDQIYPTDNPDIVIDQAITATATGELVVDWNSFTETITAAGSDAVKYTLSDDGGNTYKYWDGAAWSTSSGYAQSNTGTEVNTNIGTFPITSSGMKIKIFLHSDDGSTTPDIDNLVVNYDDFIYATDNPTVLLNSSTAMDSLDGFAETVTTPTGTAIKYTLCVDSQDKYWDGGAWSNSDGTYAQSNTAAEIETNKAALDISSGSNIKLRAFLNSDGTDTPTLTQNVIDYDFFIIVTKPNKCIVYGNILDMGVDAVVGATVKFFSSSPFLHGNNFMSVSESTTSDSDGYFELEVVETATITQTISAKITWTEDNITKRKTYRGFLVPNTASEAFSTVVNNTP